MEVKMAKKKSGNVMGFVLLTIILVALVLVVVGMFVGQVVMTELGDKKIGVSNVFGIISFIVTLAGLVVLLLDGIVHYVLGKDLKIIRFIGVAVTIVGAVLILVAGLVMAGQCKDGLGLDLGDLAQNTFSAGAGVWLGFIGGLVGAVGGGLALFKKFN